MDGNNIKKIGDNKSEKCLISIVVPCYNCQNTLDRTVESLINQEKHVSENIVYQIILVDDGSTDTTSIICDEYSTKHSEIKTIHKQNGGLVDAWKKGVLSAEGSYIAFCDSDDYIDCDFVITISEIINKYRPDLIVFGMKTEYDNGEVIENDVLLNEGFYDRATIENDLFPILLSNGDMQTELIQSSRCNKVFSKKLLEKIMEDVPENISFGEDDVTCFSAAINAESIYCIKGYYPYHYVRNTSSMIGGYDEHTFEKIELLYGALTSVSSKYSFQYKEQVDKEIMSILFLYIKKELCKNPGGYSAVYKKITQLTHSNIFVSCYDMEIIKGYGLSKKLFSCLIAHNQIMVAYIITKLLEKIRGRKV